MKAKSPIYVVMSAEQCFAPRFLRALPKKSENCVR